MSAGEHHWPGRSGSDDDDGCVDPIARRAAKNALEEAQRVGNGLGEANLLIAGVELRLTEKLTVGFELLGLRDIRKRFRDMDAERAKKTQPAFVPTPPSQREKVPSAHDIQKLADSANELKDAIDDASERFERLNGGKVVQVQPAKTSDPPEEVVKKFGIGVLTIIFKTGRDLAIEHGLRILLGLGLAAGGGTLVHYLHVWHVLK